MKRNKRGQDYRRKIGMEVLVELVLRSIFSLVFTMDNESQIRHHILMNERVNTATL